MQRGDSERAVVLRLGLAVLAVALGVGTATSARAQAVGTATLLYGWSGAAGPASATFSGVSYDGNTRTYSGHVWNGLTQTLSATAFTTSGPPGVAVSIFDLGFTVDPSTAVSIGGQGLGRFWVAVSESVGVPSTNAHILDWSAASGTTSTQMLGPIPDQSTHVTVHDVNSFGDAVGQVDGTIGLIDLRNEAPKTVVEPPNSVIFGISSNGNSFGGSGDFGSGHVATIWNQFGAVTYQDTVPGRILAIAPPFAVGERQGNVAFWRRSGASFIPVQILDSGGLPISGQLTAVDPDGFGIAGGQYAAGGAIAVVLRTGEVIELDTVLSAVPGTLWTIQGIDADPATSTVAFAAEDVDFAGWDVTASFVSDIDAELVPGPGLWTIFPILLIGVTARRMASRQPPNTARDSGFTRG